MAPFHWVDAKFPVTGDTAARVLYADRANGQHEYSYLPTEGSLGWISMSGAGLSILMLACAVVAAWMWWKVNHLFLADHAARELVTNDAEHCQQLWSACTPEERLVLVHVVRHHVINPRQRTVAAGLLDRGLLTLEPDVQTCAAMTDVVKAHEHEVEMEERLRAADEPWHGWHDARLVLAGSVGGLFLFLVSTQPQLQSDIAGVTTAIAGTLTTGLKLRDTVVAWFGRAGDKARPV